VRLLVFVRMEPEYNRETGFVKTVCDYASEYSVIK